ncbi:hypothetical protein NQ314_009525 [Rhamnusium bicolor]|uniref:Uncharacterized protein n=1 Tax=Rhamnusium bicolor TaxID=1586634 RepID=A0AAV8Y122_9CUCU|nr:hypothetical protein NQ314_009525 [Rhamnusium bicolor]
MTMPIDLVVDEDVPVCEIITEQAEKGLNVGKPCSCRIKCFEKLSQDDREKLHADFWNKSEIWEKHRQYISMLINVNMVNRHRSRTNSRSRIRANSRVYHLIVNGARIQVCKTMFLNTLSLSGKFTNLAFKKKSHQATLLHLTEEVVMFQPIRPNLKLSRLLLMVNNNLDSFKLSHL